MGKYPYELFSLNVLPNLRVTAPITVSTNFKKKKLYTNMNWAVKIIRTYTISMHGLVFSSFFCTKKKNVTLCHIQISIFISEPLAVK